MAEQSDRVVIKLGPGRLDSDKAIQRELDDLKSNVETKQTTTTGETGDITFEVTGAIPEFIGVPAGLQQFYVAPLVVNDSINASLDGNSRNFPLSPDTGNTFSTGSESVIGPEISSNVLRIINLSNGTFAELATPTIDRPIVRTSDSFSVIYGNTRYGTPPYTILVVRNEGITSFTASTGFGTILAAGPDNTGTRIFILTKVAGTRTLYGNIYDLNGTRITSYAIYTEASSTTINHGIVDNGYVAIVSSTGAMYSCLASSTLQNFKVFPNSLFSFGTSSTVVDLIKRITNNICIDPLDNHAYVYLQKPYITISSTTAIHRVDLTNGVVSTYYDTAIRYVGGSSTPTHYVMVDCLHAISGTKVVYGGWYAALSGQPDAGSSSPIYSAIVLGGLGANISDSIFTEFKVPSGSFVTTVYAITSLFNGNVVFALNGGTGGDYVLTVTGP